MKLSELIESEDGDSTFDKAWRIISDVFKTHGISIGDKDLYDPYDDDWTFEVDDSDDEKVMAAFEVAVEQLQTAGISAEAENASPPQLRVMNDN